MAAASTRSSSANSRTGFSLSLVEDRLQPVKRHPIPSHPKFSHHQPSGALWHRMSALASMANHHVLLAGRRGWHRNARQKVKDSEVTGTKYLRKLLPLLEPLHDEVCERDKAGNRPRHTIRVVEVRMTPRVKRGTERGGSSGPSFRRHSADRHEPSRRAGGCRLV